MSFYRASVALLVATVLVSCGNDKKKGNVSASLMKSKAVSVSLTSEPAASTSLLASGSLVQSFTPTSLKIPIYNVNVCKGTSGCQNIYTCSSNCQVELSNIDAFVDALNAGANKVEEGDYSYIGVQFCSEGDFSSGIQNISATGTMKIQGVDYATDPTAGIVRGTAAKEVNFQVNGGCASFYPLTSSVHVSDGSNSKVQLFFDSSLFLYAGLSGGDSNTNSYVSTGGSCVGSESAYVCAPVLTIVPTIDSGTPTTEHYLLANTDSSASNAATAKVALFFGSDGLPIGGVQNPYRMSGTSVTWGSSKMDGGLALFPKVVDATTVSFGEPEGSISLANWFKAFKRSSHTGTYTYARGTSATTSETAEGNYKATKL